MLRDNSIFIHLFVFLVASIVAVLSYVTIDSYRDSSIKFLDKLKSEELNRQKDILRERVISIAKLIEFLSENRAISKLELLKRLKEINIDSSVDRHLFVFELFKEQKGGKFGELLLTENSVIKEGELLDIDFQDVDGKFIFKKVLELIESKGEAFLTYRVNKPSIDRATSKIGYFYLFREWSWVIGAGIYIDKIESRYLEHREMIDEYRNSKIEFMFINIAILIVSSEILIFIFYLIYKKFFRAKELQMQAILNSLDNITILSNREKLINCNRRALEFFGYQSLEELQRESSCICDFFIKREGYLFGDRDECLNYIESNSKDLKVIMYDRESKEERVFLLKSSKYSIDDKLLVISFTDITEDERERDYQEAFLIQQSKMAQMGELISIITHQLKQPLYSISLISSSIEEYYYFDELSDDIIERETKKIYSQVEFMSESIDDLRNFLNPNKVKVKFNILNAIQEICRIFSIQLKRLAIEIEIESKESSIYIYGFENEFKQVILNILNNSKEAIVERDIKNGLITINIEKRDEVVSIEILDNGGGVDNSLLLDKIFEPNVTTKVNGSGVGLYLSYKIVQSMQGKIGVMNTQIGVKFQIEFPLLGDNLKS